MSETQLPTNWGRWGDDDQLGTLHLIDTAAKRRAAAEVTDGHHISLARRIRPVSLTTGLSPVGSPATMPAGVMQAVNFNGAKPLAMTDTLVINTHNAALTHLDALAHMPVDEHIYPGVPVHAAVTPTGVTHGSADPFGEGLVTRGVLLDLAPGAAACPPTDASMVPTSTLPWSGQARHCPRETPSQYAADGTRTSPSTSQCPDWTSAPCTG